MDEQSRGKMRQLAFLILPLLQVMMGEAVQFRVVDSFSIDAVSVAIWMGLAGVLRFWDWFQQTPEWPALRGHFYRYSRAQGLQSLADA